MAARFVKHPIRRVGPASNASAGPPGGVPATWWAGAAYQPLVPPYDS
jgi:hypothetical protein